MAMVPWIDESMLREPFGTTMERTIASSVKRRSKIDGSIDW